MEGQIEGFTTQRYYIDIGLSYKLSTFSLNNECQKPRLPELLVDIALEL